MQTINKS